MKKKNSVRNAKRRGDGARPLRETREGRFGAPDPSPLRVCKSGGFDRYIERMPGASVSVRSTEFRWYSEGSLSP